MLRIHATGLKAETTYQIFCVFEDFVGNLSRIFSLYHFTEEMHDSIMFRVKFIGTAPTTAEISGVVIPAIASTIALANLQRMSLVS